MPILTDEEADALDELLTKNPPKTNPNAQGPFIKNRETLVFLDPFSAEYLKAKAMAARKTPAEVIGELVREKIAASV
jgi:hypothetical protein